MAIVFASYHERLDNRKWRERVRFPVIAGRSVLSRTKITSQLAADTLLSDANRIGLASRCSHVMVTMVSAYSRLTVALVSAYALLLSS